MSLSAQRLRYAQKLGTRPGSSSGAVLELHRESAEDAEASACRGAAAASALSASSL